MVITSTPIEEARPSTNESLINTESVDQEMLRHRALLVVVADSIRREQGPNAAADVHLINTSLYHLAYKLDVESPSFTNTIIQVAQSGQPMVYKPDVEFHLTLLQCDPYKFDPGDILAIHLEARVASEDKIQSVDENKSVAYTMNSRAQGYMAEIVEDLPQVVSPLAAYSGQDNGLAWHNQEVPTLGTLASNEDTQLPHPQFEAR
ncbi:hypothetical protein BS47DRAFT_1357955 [Hydnum rufescens UP504]|uniref:Uncharacterized protein n=1 Tax=Hydnum rufescens UP504 TaxID=1448309 RepID=A0A9P6E2A9_9AGAM|nr:hypothetical protein BS47DRAFT_1357955 [Hydnum rufescens UP504]